MIKRIHSSRSRFSITRGAFLSAVMSLGLTTSSTLAQPAAETPSETAPLDLAMDAAEVERFAPSDWQTVKLDLSTDQLSLAWDGMDSMSRRELLGAVTACRTFIATNPKTQSVFNLTVFVFNDAALAQRAVSDLEGMSRSNIENGTIPSLTPDAVVYGTLGAMEADGRVSASSTVAFQTQVSEQAAVDLYTARAAKGNAVIEFMRINHDVGDQVVEEAIQALFSEVVGELPELAAPESIDELDAADSF